MESSQILTKALQQVEMLLQEIYCSAERKFILPFCEDDPVNTCMIQVVK